MSNQLYDAAYAAVNRLFCDQSLTREETRDKLEELRAELDAMIDTLKKDV